MAIEPENLEAIVEASDGVMVARGDLAVEAGAEVVPVVQRKIIALCGKHGKLSIIATQMMASMVRHPEPSPSCRGKRCCQRSDLGRRYGDAIRRNCHGQVSTRNSCSHEASDHVHAGKYPARPYFRCVDRERYKCECRN